ncbi:hypothetical protein [Nostoc sp. JL33]|uniref:hypothetical protein n=1 Tax=Nostoc sp. JL33 TaxID=2815396 RepID=UPI0025EFB2DF|nr:hypothetical protein [Nostoc sp. JL33]MBN3871634.1 hypothetical protein [Nostoc sp. JL33]
MTGYITDLLIQIICSSCQLEHYFELNSLPGGEEYCEYCEECSEKLALETEL